MANRIVAVTDSVFPNLDAAREVVAKVGGDLRLAKAPTPEGILEVARDADAILCTYAKVTTAVVEQLTRCRIISRFGIGVDNVDIAMATSKGIVVTKVPDYCIDEVSDHAVALLLAIVRKIPFSNSEVQEGRWAMPSENFPARRAPASARPTNPSTSSTRDRGMPLLAASARRWARALRPGWNALASSSAPTSRSGQRSSR